jgi:hypothetical protein
VIARLGLTLLGAYVGLIGGAVHRHSVELGGIHWPWGLVLALAVLAAVAAGAERIARLGAAWFAIGWSLVLLGQSLSPDGSYLVAADWIGYVYAVLGLGSLAVIIVRGSKVQR